MNQNFHKIVKVQKNLLRSMSKKTTLALIFLLVATISAYQLDLQGSNPQFAPFSDPVQSYQKENFDLGYNLSSELVLNYEQVGDQQDFWFMNWGVDEYQQAHATLLSVGEHCYVYMQNESIVILGEEEAFNICRIVRNEFERTIYPVNYDLIGNPDGNLGDIDGDRHITIFLAEESAAYYSPINEQLDHPYSNHREMIYTFSRPGIYEILRDVCHETNHLFLFNYDLTEAVFIYEGLAEFCKYYAGYLSNSSFLRNGATENMTISLTYFADYPYLSLFFFDESEPTAGYGSYGIAYLFILYLSEKYGLQVIKDIATNDSYDGPKSIEYALENQGYSISFNELYLDFITACTIDHLGIYNNKYGFENLNFRVDITNEILKIPTSYNNVKHRYYGIISERIWGLEDQFTLEIKTPDYPRSVGVVIAIMDENGWNITKAILTGDGSTKVLLCNGKNIDSVFLITSLIKEGTPPAIYSFMSCPFSLLDIGVKQGHINTNATSASSIVLSIPIIVTSFLLRKKSRTYKI